MELGFVSGTHLATLRGDVPVNELRMTDQLKTKSGAYTPILRLRKVDVRFHEIQSNRLLETSTLRRGALGDGLPKRDLHVTANQEFASSQSMKINHHLRMASRGIPVQFKNLGHVEFILVKTAEAAPVCAEGIWTMSTPCAMPLSVMLLNANLEAA